MDHYQQDTRISLYVEATYQSKTVKENTSNNSKALKHYLQHL